MDVCHPRTMDGSTRPQRYARSHPRGGLKSGAPTDLTDGRRLLDRMGEALQARHYSPRTAEAYRGWVKRFVFFHGLRHPAEMGESEINAFLTHLAVNEKVSASTQNQALSALLFLYRCVLDREVGDLGDVIRAKHSRRLPVVLTREEARAVLDRLTGDKWLIASLLYGSGLRLMECLHLRVKDLEFSRGEVTVRDGQARRLSHLPSLLRHAPARSGLRHPHHPGAPGPQRRAHDDGLHARAEPGRPRCAQPA